MKKRLLLAILPALLALSSCSAQPKAKAEPQFLEDTLAHEEVFGGNDNGEYLYKGTKLNFDDYADVPTDDNLRPAIGVQHQLDSTEQYISIRFVAAIKVSGALSDTTAVWTRAMYNPDGSILKDFATKSSLKAYEEINNAGSALHITTFNGSYETHYNYFVVYTMLNIKLADYANCYLNAYLTLGDGKKTLELAVPVRTDISANNVWKFEASQHYFIRLNPFATNQEDFAQDATTQGENPEYNYASFTHSFVQGDEFVLVANDVDNKRFKIYDASCLRGDPSAFAFNNVSGKIKANYDESVILYLNKAGEIYTNVVSQIYQLFVNDVLSSIESIIPSGKTDKAWFSGVAIANDNTPVKIKLNGNQVGEITVPASGSYNIGINSGNSIWYDGDLVTINIRVDCTNKGDVTGWGGKVFIIGDFCEWSTKNANAIMLTETGAGTKIWTGSVSWKYGHTYEYQVRLNNLGGTWEDANNWYPGSNKTFMPSTTKTSLSETWQ